MIRRKIIAIILLLFFIGQPIEVCAVNSKYPDFATEFLGPDKHEKFNRKMINFNLGLNKYCIRPIHILWASIFPQYVMDRILGITLNIEYPIRLVSTIVQRDFKRTGIETERFLINTTIGLAGMFDPAKRYFHIDYSKEDMDKALAKCHVKSGVYFVVPVINFTSIRNLCGRVLDAALDPTTYIGTPVIAIISASMTINKTAFIQYIIILLEANFVDPYYITKLAFGINEYIKQHNYDRVDVLSKLQANSNDSQDKIKPINSKKKKTRLSVSAKLASKEDNKEEKNIPQEIVASDMSLENEIQLKNYYPQAPVTDSMRTILFNLPDASKSIWNEVSPWNRSFINRTKTMKVSVFEGREDYTFRYLLQKDKKAPLAIIYPSTGDGIFSSHPLMFAKMFYDAGYSIVIEGNPFQWEFVKSMPDGYAPGLPEMDAIMMRKTTAQIVDKLQAKYKHEFKNKIVFGTSLGALDVLHIAAQESENNTLGDTQYIAICPPIDLLYSINKVDAYAEEWLTFSEEIKEKVAFASAKLVKIFLNDYFIDFDVNQMPFDEDEAKIFTSFMMRQKLANVVFALEKAPTNQKTNIYDLIDNMGFLDYFAKYIMANKEDFSDDLNKGIGLKPLSAYLKNGSNYKIYHSKNDYLINDEQLQQLKDIAGKNLYIIDNGSHMGFLYRPEFQAHFRGLIANIMNNL